MSKFSISPKGAFSCEWNKCIDRNASYAVRLVSSMHAFLKALFFMHTVCIIEVNGSFLASKSIHEHSLFGKEYRKKLIDIRACLQCRIDGLSKVDREILARVLVEDIEQSCQNGNFRTVILNLNDNVKLLNKKECCRLLTKVCIPSVGELSPDVRDRVSVACTLLSTGHCYELINSLFGEKKNPLSFFVDNDFIIGAVHIIKNCTAALNESGMGGRTPMMLAAERGEVSYIRELMKQGVNINACDDNGMTALHHAAFHGQLESISVLLEVGNGLVAVNAKNDEGMTALHLSVKSRVANRGKCIEELVLKGGFDINAKDNKKRTALHIAALERGGHNDNIVNDLLSLKNILLGEKDCDGCTPLHYSAAGCIEIFISSLLKAGASIYINAKNNAGNTPLHCALLASRFRNVDFLLEAGANKHERNDEGETPLDIAKKKCVKGYVKFFNNKKKLKKKSSQASGD